MSEIGNTRYLSKRVAGRSPAASVGCVDGMGYSSLQSANHIIHLHFIKPRITQQ